MDAARRRRTRRFRCAAALAVALSVLPRLAYAQCVMCGKNAEFAEDGEPGRAYATLATAALVLIVPTLSMVGGLAVYVWKHRRR